MLMKCPEGCEGPFVEGGDYCPYCGAKLEERTEPIRHTLYIHSDSNSNAEKGAELGLTGEALKIFRHVGYEVGLVLEVDPTTGGANLIGIEDVDVDAGVIVIVRLAKAVEI